MRLRPYGVVLEGRLELGLEIEVEDGKVAAIKPHTGIPDDYVLSPAFVNAHSHLEYRGLQGKIFASEWWPWIREITRLKADEEPAFVRAATQLAATENRRAGVSLIAEHSDRPFAAQALTAAGIQGAIFQEVITFFESESPEEKLRAVEERAAQQRTQFRGDVWLNPHSVYTVDRRTLADFGQSKHPISLHLAESPEESNFTRSGTGPVADFYRRFGVPFESTGLSAYGYAHELGLLRSGAQVVHACDLTEDEIDGLSRSGASVAHCPRSNQALGCPIAKVREMLDSGIRVGLGMDSPASSGPIDMFSEMRCAMRLAELRGAPLSAEEVWRMATDMGAASVGKDPWRIEVGASVPMIKISVEGAIETANLIERGSAGMVSWV